MTLPNAISRATESLCIANCVCKSLPEESLPSLIQCKEASKGERIQMSLSC